MGADIDPRLRSRVYASQLPLVRHIRAQAIPCSVVAVTLADETGRKHSTQMSWWLVLAWETVDVVNLGACVVDIGESENIQYLKIYNKYVFKEFLL